MPRRPITFSPPLLPLLLFMASFLLLSLFLFSSPSRPPPKSLSSSASQAIHQACAAATRFPDSCESSLSQSDDLPASPTPMDLIFSSIKISARNLQTARALVQTILRSAGSDKDRTNAARNCLEFLAYSDHRLALSSGPAILPANRAKDARAWMSAALLHQYDCYSALKYVNTTRAVDSSIAFLLRLSELTSNALSLLVAYDRFGPDTAAWRPPLTERQGYWEDMSVPAPAIRSRWPAVENANVTVCKNGCDYAAVQAAVDAAPAKLPTGVWFTIYIKEGVYKETVRVPLEKTNLVFLGDGMGKTVITGNRHAGMVGASTYNTATVAVAGDGFMARKITFENRAGPDVHQAVAFRSTADRTVVAFCEFLGYQDTLYAHALRQYYYACDIYGTVDFVFGNSATVFDTCLFLVRPRQLQPERGESNAVTAHGRTDPAQSTGFVIRNSNINGTEEYMRLFRQKPRAHRTYLGRPWKEYSRTMFVNCLLEALVRPEGWMPWKGDFALQTLYYGEHQSSGAGAADLTGRVQWSSQIPAERIGVYTAGSFIQGNEWIPDS